MLYLKMFIRRISKDFKQKELLPLKLLFFIHASTLFVLYPYLTIHMRELGISVEETAIMSAVIPVVAIIMPPVAGMIADKIGNFKILLAIFSTLGGLSALLLLLVPVGRVTITYPDRVVTGLSCNANRRDTHMTLSVFQNHPCTPAHPFKYNTVLEVESCGFVCQALTDKNYSSSILSTDKYTVQLHDYKTNSSNTFNYNLATEDLQKNVMQETKNHQTLKNDERYKTAIRKLSQNSFFFPTSGLFNFSCELRDSQYNVTNNSGEFDIDSDNKNYVCRFGTSEQVKSSTALIKRFMVSVRPKNETDDLENMLLFNVDTIGEDTTYHPGICTPGYGQTQHVSISVPIGNRSNEEISKTLELGSCAPRCLVTTPRKDLCSNMKDVVEIDMSVTFWSYLAVRVFIAMIGGTAFAMFEGAVIAILREKKADYGLQRIYASIGGMISSPLSGWLIDYFSQGKGYTDFRPAFYLYACLKVASGLLMLAINLEFKVPAANVVADVVSVLKKVELIALFISCFILGTAWGYIESFLFWLLQDLGGSRSLMGFTITVGGIAGIPLLVLSGPIIKRIGHANVIFIGFLFYGIRLLGYSLIYNPWYCLIFEAMESVTSSLSFTAAVTYAAKLSSVTTDSSIQGMLGGIYYGVGKGAGSLIGGFLMKLVGTRPTYQIFAVICVVTGFIYFLFNLFCIKKSEDEKKEADIPQTFVDLPPGFVDVDLTPSWNPESELSLEEGGGKQAKDGVVNKAYDNNDNDIKKNDIKMTEYINNDENTEKQKDTKEIKNDSNEDEVKKDNKDSEKQTQEESNL